MEEPTIQPEPFENQAQVTPTSSAAQPVPTPDLPVDNGQKLPDQRKSSNKLAFALLALVVLALAGGAYYLVNHKPAQKAAVVVKHDIPLITFASGERSFNSFYPGIDNSANFTGPNRQIFEGLVEWQNGSKIIPMLATSWTNPDTSTWVFTLKPNVKFHTGRVMTADDVKASFDEAKATGSSAAADFNSTIKSVTVLAPNKVEIKTDGPDPVLLNRLAQLYVYDTKSGKANDPINGTGPYVVKPGTTPGNDELDLVAFDGYHGGHVYTRALTFKYVALEDLAKAYDDNILNFVYFSFASGSTPVTRDHQTIKVQPLSVFHIILNSRRAGSPLANLKVRQAIRLGTDPAALAKVRHVEAVPIGQIIPPTVPGYLPNATRPATDVAKAKALLAEAGYPNGFTITFTYFGSSQATAEEISRQFKAMGITLKLDPQTDVNVLAPKVYGGGTDMSYNTVSTDIFDGSDVAAQYLDSANYTNPKVKPLLDQVNKTLDQTERLKLIQQLEQIDIDDVADVPIYAIAKSPQITESNFVVVHDVPGGDDVGVFFWKVYAK